VSRRLPALIVGLLLTPWLMGVNAPVAAAAPAFAFNWTGVPSAPQRWVPASMNDWDVLTTNNVQASDGIISGAFQASHGAGCEAPPASHQVASLADTVFLCNNHMMTAENDTDTFFTPNQLVDFSHGTAVVSVQVSTARFSSRDWWEVWLSPYSENYVMPTDNAPAFNGNPDDALHIFMNQRVGCAISQPGWGNVGTMFEYVMYRGGNAAAKGGGGPCMEDAAGGPSPKQRSTFELDVSQSHVKFVMHGAAGDAVWVDDNMNLGFNQAVVTWAHRSYNPSKACGFDGTCGPSTFHWSNVSISPSVPFTMLRPNGNASIHDGTPTTVKLPAPAPANSFLRFAAFGNVQVSYNGGGFVAPHMQDTAERPEGASNYFSPVPAGTTTLSFQGSPRSNIPWWVADVAVWASATPVTLSGRTPPAAPAQPAVQPPAAAASVAGGLFTEWDALRAQGVAPHVVRPAATTGPLAALTRIPPFISGFGSAVVLMALAGLGYVFLRRRQRRRGRLPRPPDGAARSA
jgi:hypothetical protein